MDVVNFLRTEFPDLNIYPLELPLKAPVGSSSVNVYGNVEAVAGLYPITVQIKVRDNHPSKSEADSYRYKSLLENKSNFDIGGVQVVLVKSQNPMPLYMGKDEKGYYLYSNNFRFLINEGGNK
jgi:Bacteriophage minor capsid protein